MSTNYAKLSGRSVNSQTPQTQKILGTNQQKNNAGGYSYVISDWNVLDRFLIIGTSNGSYYVSAEEQTKFSCDVLEKLVKSDAKRVVDRIVEVSDKGLGIKNTPAVFALAFVVKNTADENKKYALSNLSKVCRISTDLFAFVEFYKQLGGGFGSSVRKAINKWYQSKTPDSIAYQMVKYRQRNGWTHHDVLHLSHAKAKNEQENTCFLFAKQSANKSVDMTGKEMPRIIEGYIKASKAKSEKEIVKLITDYKLPREAIPTNFLNNASVWEAMLEDMPATALIRNLGVMSSNGLLQNLSSSEKLVVKKLSDVEWLRKSRVHPISVLTASKIYGKGTGFRGTNSWNVNRRIVDVLQNAFYSCFDNVEPTDETYLLGVDISGSMTWEGSSGINGVLTAAECAIALAMVLNKQNENSLIMGFSTRFINLNIRYTDKFETALKRVYGSGFGGTDCSLPMRYATEHKLDVDKFIVITDSETYAGGQHPSEALRDYRNKMKKNSGLIVCATSATQFSIADPKDPKQIDIAGFSPDVPRIINAL
jgi:60 kDa SS-A/Ro ribonucleoprotein